MVNFNQTRHPKCCIVFKYFFPFNTLFFNSTSESNYKQHQLNKWETQSKLTTITLMHEKEIKTVETLENRGPLW